MRTNSPATGARGGAADTLRVAETFASLQGESTWAGLPCFFIRLAGCNLDCRYCDTRAARDPAVGEDLTLAALVARAVSAAVPLVEITGGEPLMQKETPALCRALVDAGKTVLVETNGSLPLDRLPSEVIRIMDVKCPASGMADRLHRANFATLRPRDEVKFVLADRADYDYACCILRDHRLTERTANLLFSPAWGLLDPADLAAWILADRLPVRLQLQLHKILWGPDCKGV
jgi:7-carboxy-7-deazaguanine synthase